MSCANKDLKTNDAPNEIKPGSGLLKYFDYSFHKRGELHQTYKLYPLFSMMNCVAFIMIKHNHKLWRSFSFKQFYYDSLRLSNKRLKSQSLIPSSKIYPNINRYLKTAYSSSWNERGSFNNKTIKYLSVCSRMMSTSHNKKSNIESIQSDTSIQKDNSSINLRIKDLEIATNQLTKKINNLLNDKDYIKDKIDKIETELINQNKVLKELTQIVSLNNDILRQLLDRHNSTQNNINNQKINIIDNYSFNSQSEKIIQNKNEYLNERNQGGNRNMQEIEYDTKDGLSISRQIYDEIGQYEYKGLTEIEGAVEIIGSSPNGGSYFYIGQVENESLMRNGIGINIDSDGSIYEGQYKDDNANGYGRAIWPDGEYYVGELKDRQPNGYGEFYYADGSVYKGNFQDGDAHGQGTLTYPNGSEEEGKWDKGILIQ